MTRALLAAGLLLAGCTKLDPLPGAYYPCHRDGGKADECPGAWHCGLEARCLPNDAGAWACASDDDCFGWHCGLGADAQSSGVCHDPAVAMAYRCRTDAHCEQGWRCGPDGVCLDTSAEALRPNADVPVALLEADEPLWTGRPDTVSVSRVFAGPNCSGGGVNVNSAVTRFDVTAGGELVQVFWSRPARECLPDGGAHYRVLSVERAPLGDVEPVESVSLSWGALVRQRDGGVVALTLDAGAVTATPLVVGFVPKRFRLGLGDDVALAFDDTHVSQLGLGSVRSWSVNAGLVIHDVAELGTPLASPYRTLATNVGLYRLADDGQLFPVAPPDYPCAPASYFDAIQLTSEAPLGAQSAVLVARDVTGSLRITRYLPSADAGSPGACEMLGGNYSTIDTQASAQPPVGDLRAVLAGVQTPWRAGVVVSTTLDGGLDVRFGEYSPQEGPFPRVTGDVAFSSANPNRAVFADARGHLWLSSNFGTALPLVAVNLSRPPDVLSGADPLWAEVAAEPLSQDVELEPDTLYLYEPGLGFAVWSGKGVSSNVVGAPNWLVVNTAYPDRATSLVDGSDLLANRSRVLASHAGYLPGPVHAAKRTTPDGGSLVVLTSGDVVWTADVTEAVERDAGPAALRPVLVPLPSGAITSLALASEPVAGASLANGYLVANGRLFRLRADNPVVWKSDELDLGPAEVVVVWTDRERGRVALRDGTVLSLPSRVALAPPLPNGAELRELADRCGNPLALARWTSDAGAVGGVFRLVSDGGVALGAWEPVTSVRAPPSDLGDARLHDDGTAVRLISAQGAHESLGATCAP